MTDSLANTARALVAPGKGILAADESSPTIKKRFDAIGAESTEESRRNYREMLFTTAGAAEHISGVILFDETLRQTARDGRRLADVLVSQGIIPGIKVDKGAHPLPGHDGEKVTEGLDGLRERVAEYVGLGARFAKWRGVIAIDAARGLPSRACLATNAHALARYAAICQEGGLVPIVEPELLMDGTHTVEQSDAASSAALEVVFDELYAQGVSLAGMLLKPNMILSGYDCPKQASVQEVAERTVNAFRRHVPAEVPGIVFLSGGQADELATAHLDAMNRMDAALRPWELSFSYGRALQAPALKAWGGKTEKEGAGQAAYLHRAKMNGLARYGKYAASMESGAATGVSLASQD